MVNRPSSPRWEIWAAAALALVGTSAFPAEQPVTEAPPAQTLTSAAAVRALTAAQAGQKLPVRLRGAVTFFFNTRSCFVQDESAGIFVGNGAEFSSLAPGDLVLIEGVSDPGEYAPLVIPAKLEVLGHTNLPPPRPVSFEDLMTGREDSQYVEVSGLGRSVSADPSGYQNLEIVSGGGRLAVFVPASVQSNLLELVDSQVRVRGVCGTWFNRQRQLFGVRLMVPRPEDIIVVEKPAATNPTGQLAQAIGDLLRFAANASSGHRVKVKGTVVLQQPGRALFVQDDRQGLYVQTRQRGRLQPGDHVELLGFPANGDYTPMLQDGAWRWVGFGPEPQPALVRSDEALSGLYDSRLVMIEGQLLNQARNNRETVLALEADGRVFSAQVDYSPEADRILGSLRPESRVRLKGVCRIVVGEEWRAGSDWRAEAFRILLRGPTDVQVLAQPPWWTLTRLLWAVGVLTAVGVGSLMWITLLHRKVGQQTTIIRRQLEQEAAPKKRDHVL